MSREFRLVNKEDIDAFLSQYLRIYSPKLFAKSFEENLSDLLDKSPKDKRSETLNYIILQLRDQNPNILFFERKTINSIKKIARDLQIPLDLDLFSEYLEGFNHKAYKLSELATFLTSLMTTEIYFGQRDCFDSIVQSMAESERSIYTPTYHNIIQILHHIQIMGGIHEGQRRDLEKIFVRLNDFIKSYSHEKDRKSDETKTVTANEFADLAFYCKKLLPDFNFPPEFETNLLSKLPQKKPDQKKLKWHPDKTGYVEKLGIFLKEILIKTNNENITLKQEWSYGGIRDIGVRKCDFVFLYAIKTPIFAVEFDGDKYHKAIFIKDRKKSEEQNNKTKTRDKILDAIFKGRFFVVKDADFETAQEETAFLNKIECGLLEAIKKIEKDVWDPQTEAMAAPAQEVTIAEGESLKKAQAEVLELGDKALAVATPKVLEEEGEKGVKKKKKKKKKKAKDLGLLYDEYNKRLLKLVNSYIEKSDRESPNIHLLEEIENLLEEINNQFPKHLKKNDDLEALLKKHAESGESKILLLRQILYIEGFIKTNPNEERVVAVKKSRAERFGSRTATLDSEGKLHFDQKLLVENKYKKEAIIEFINLFFNDKSKLHFLELIIVTYPDFCKKISRPEGLILVEASCKGYINIVRILIKNSCDVNIVIPEADTTALRVACENGDLEMVKLLVTNGADVNYVFDKDGVTSLFMAAQEGHVDVVDFLIKNKASINCARKDGQTPLLVACAHGHTETVRILIEYGAKIEEQVTNVRINALMMASWFGHEDVVDLLIEKGASLNAKSAYSGATALFFACDSCSISCHNVAELLINKGADVNLAIEVGTTPLMAACIAGNKNTVELLIDAKADVKVSRDADGASAFSLACQDVAKLGIAQLLVNADPTLVNQSSPQSGVNPLIAASHAGKIEIVELLINSGADVNCKTAEGITPLIAASHAGKIEIESLLVKNGATPSEVVSSASAQRPNGATVVRIFF